MELGRRWHSVPRRARDERSMLHSSKTGACGLCGSRSAERLACGPRCDLVSKRRGQICALDGLAAREDWPSAGLTPKRPLRHRLVTDLSLRRLRTMFGCGRFGVHDTVPREPLERRPGLAQEAVAPKCGILSELGAADAKQQRSTREQQRCSLVSRGIAVAARNEGPLGRWLALRGAAKVDTANRAECRGRRSGCQRSSPLRAFR